MYPAAPSPPPPPHHCRPVRRYARRAEWQAALERALLKLGTFADGVEVMHLLANTTKETTVVGRVRKSASADATGSDASSHAEASQGAQAFELAWMRSRLISGRGS